MKSIFEDFERSLTEAASTRAKTQHDTRRPKPGFLSPRGMLRALSAVAIAAVCAALVVFVATSVHPGARSDSASAARGASPSTPGQRLADGGVDCFWGTTGHGASSDTFASDMPALNGQDPVSSCRRAYRLDYRYHNFSPDLTNLPKNPRFIACEGTPTLVYVYFASSDAGQCELNGVRGLPAGYATARSQLVELQAGLLRVDAENNCYTRAAIVNRARAVLDELHFSGWNIRAVTNPSIWPAHTIDSCFSLSGGGLTPNYKMPGLNTAEHQVLISPSVPRSIGKHLDHIEVAIYTRSYNRCFDATTIRSLVAHWFGRINLQPLYATVARQGGGHYEPKSEQLYRQGCVRFETGFVTTDAKHVDVVLLRRGAKHIPNATFPPAQLYQP